MSRTRSQSHVKVIVRLCLFLAWVLINAADVAWIYNYDNKCILPDPNSANSVNFVCPANSDWMVLIVGFALSGVNGVVFGDYFSKSDGPSYDDESYPLLSYGNDYRPGLGLFNWFVMAPVAAAMTLGPFFAPMFVIPSAQSLNWIHGCDNYPLEVVLSAKAYYDPVYKPNTASYFQGNTSTPLFTYDIFQSSANVWSFDLRAIDSPDIAQNQSSVMYPSISKITYNFLDGTVAGTCTSPHSNTTSPCIEGSYSFIDNLSLELTDLRSNSTTSIHAVSKMWRFRDRSPKVLLLDEVGAQILRTDVTKKGDCTRLKVCVARNSGAAIIAPMGLILIPQMDHATRCTTPEPTTIIIAPTTTIIAPPQPSPWRKQSVWTV